MAECRLYQLCRFCNGTGVITTYPAEGPPIGGPCPKCDETGIFPLGYITNPDKVFDAYVILECLDVTEYNGLTEAQQAGVGMLLNCGKVDLNDGKAGKVRLWNWFGAESTTVANLTALIE
jgi:hypothetical protein